MIRSIVRTTLGAALLLLATSCGSVAPTKFVNPNFNFGFVERVAILPMDNMTEDRQAADQASRLLVTELLASGAVDVVEPGEVRAAMAKAGISGGSPSKEQVIALGKSLGAQAVMTGAVTQAGNVRAGTLLVPVVTVDVHLLETETGAPVWAATVTEKGTSFGAQFFGTTAEASSETMRKAMKEVVRRLVG